MALTKEATPMVGQVGGKSEHKKPVLTLAPDYILKPLTSDHRGIREVALYEALAIVRSQTSNVNHLYSMFLNGREEKKNMIQRTGELFDTIALAVAIMLKDPIVKKSDLALQKAWKAVKKETEAIHRLAKFIPRYYGVVGQDGVSHNLGAPYGITEDAYLMLQSLTKSFSKPCVMDLKMGTQTFEPDATEEKQIREFSKYPHQADFGFRIVGMSVYDPNHVNADEKGFRMFGKDYGRKLQTRKQVRQAFRTFFSAGVKTDTNEDRERNERVRVRSLSNTLLEMRPLRRWHDENGSLEFRASSLLLIYEGDPVKGNGDATLLKMIDFGHVRRDSTGDLGYRVGLKSITSFLTKIIEEEEQYVRLPMDKSLPLSLVDTIAENSDKSALTPDKLDPPANLAGAPSPTNGVVLALSDNDALSQVSVVTQEPALDSLTKIETDEPLEKSESSHEPIIQMVELPPSNAQQSLVSDVTLGSDETL
jgi:hypothetical protein